MIALVTFGPYQEVINCWFFRRGESAIFQYFSATVFILNNMYDLINTKKFAFWDFS